MQRKRSAGRTAPAAPAASAAPAAPNTAQAILADLEKQLVDAAQEVERARESLRSAELRHAHIAGQLSFASRITFATETPPKFESGVEGEVPSA